MRSFLVSLLLGVICAAAQPAPPPPEQFMADYAHLLLAQDREALIRLYSPRGSLMLGDGADDFLSPERNAELYRTQWTGPTAFTWENLSYRRLHPEVVIVSGGFKWTSREFPQGAHFDYSAILAFEEDKWRIRSEAEFLVGASTGGAVLAPTVAPEVAASGGPIKNPPCVFCEIVAGKRQQEGVVYRDDQVMAFLSIGPRNPGHVLVVPLAHAENFLDVPGGTMHAMTGVAHRIARAIQRTDLKMEGFTLQMNTGKAAGQSVFHAHLHLIPRFTGEAPAKTPEERVGMDVLAPVAAKIRAALGSSPVGSVLAPTYSREVAASGDPAFKLPALGEEVPLAKIKEVCAHYGLHALWAKIEKDPPPRPFKSDGCTGWFDDWRGVSLYPAGFLHDLKYWAGYPGEDVERLVADAELMTDVARLLKSTTMAETMFHGVRVGGTEQLQTPFSWGFGRQAAR